MYQVSNKVHSTVSPRSHTAHQQCQVQAGAHRHQAMSDSAENVSYTKLELEPQARAQLTVLPSLHSMVSGGSVGDGSETQGYPGYTHVCIKQVQ